MTALARHSTAWFNALDAFMVERMYRPFAWGLNDCCTCAADWVVLARGADPMADLQPLMVSLRESSPLRAQAIATRWLAEQGGLLQVVTQRMGEPLPGPMAQIGDVALVAHGQDRQSMGVCIGHHVAAPGPDGLQLVSLSDALACWRV